MCEVREVLFHTRCARLLKQCSQLGAGFLWRKQLCVE